MAAATRAGRVARRLNRAARLIETLAGTDGTHALTSGYTAAHLLLASATDDLIVALGQLKNLRKQELAENPPE